MSLPETRAMPTEYRLRLEDVQRLQHFGGEAIEPDKQQSIEVTEGYSLGRFPP